MANFDGTCTSLCMSLQLSSCANNLSLVYVLFVVLFEIATLSVTFALQIRRAVRVSGCTKRGAKAGILETAAVA